MSYELVLNETDGGGKAGGENIFVANLPAEIPVYVFYYPAETRSPELERALRSLGERTGTNLFVNMGRLDDPQFNKIARAFDIKSLPAVVVTGIADLAAPTGETMNTYVRLDKKLLSSSETAIGHIEHLYLLFLRGEVAEAIKSNASMNRGELLKKLRQFFARAVKGLTGYLSSRDFSVSVLEGRLEITKSAQ